MALSAQSVSTSSTRQALGARGEELELFELAAGDFAVVAEDVAQGRRDVGIGGDAGLGKAVADHAEQGLVAVGIAGQGAAVLHALDQRAQRVLAA